MKRRQLRRLAAKLSMGALALLLAALVLDSLALLVLQHESWVAGNLILQLALLAGFWWWTTLRSGTLLNAPFVLVLVTFFWHSSFLAGRYLDVDEIFEFPGSVLTYGAHFVPLAVALIALCIAAAVTGALLAHRQERRRHRRLLRSGGLALQHFAQPASPAGAGYAWALFCGYLLLTVVYFAFEGRTTLTGDYMDQYLNPSGTALYRAYQMTKFLGVPCIALVIATARSRRSVWAALAGTLVLVFLSALTGARTLPFLYCTALILAIDCFHRPLPLGGVAFLGLAAAVASRVMSEGRAIAVGLAMFTTGAGQPFSLWHILWNSGGSVRSVLRTMEFSLQDGLQYGLTFLHALVFVVPAPLVAVVAPGWKVLPPSEWMIARSADVELGHGLGYSIIAEAYLNFGVAGCLLFLPLGWLVARQFFRFRFSRDLFSGVQSLSLTALLALHMRSDAVTYLRVLVWSMLVIWVCRRVDRASASRRRREAATAVEAAGAAARA